VVNDGSNVVLEKISIENNQTKCEGLGSKYILGLDNAPECCPSGFEVVEVAFHSC